MKKKSPLRIDQLDIFFYWIVEQRRETIEQFYIRSNENFLKHELQKERLPDKVVFRARTADKTMFRSFDFAWSHWDTNFEYFYMLRQNWQIIWEWFYQKHLYDETPFQVYPYWIDATRNRFGETSERFLAEMKQLPAVKEEEHLYWEIDDFSSNHYDLISLVLDFEEDRHNTEEVMRNEGLYYEEVLNTWVDLAYSLPAIGRAIRSLHIDEVTR